MPGRAGLVRGSYCAYQQSFTCKNMLVVLNRRMKTYDVRSSINAETRTLPLKGFFHILESNFPTVW